jgi:DNA invertase Pin-like site-specific DNA recombinase
MNAELTKPAHSIHCANLERPAVRALMQDIETGQVDCVVVYKVDRLSRSCSISPG